MPEAAPLVDRRGWYRTRAGQPAYVRSLVGDELLSRAGSVFVLTGASFHYWKDSWWRPDGRRNPNGTDEADDLVAFWEGPAPEATAKSFIPKYAPPIGTPATPEPPPLVVRTGDGVIPTPGQALYLYSVTDRGLLLTEWLFLRPFEVEEAEADQELMDWFSKFQRSGADCWCRSGPGDATPGRKVSFLCAKLAATKAGAVVALQPQLVAAHAALRQKERARGRAADQARRCHLKARVRLRDAEADLEQAERDLAAYNRSLKEEPPHEH